MDKKKYDVGIVGVWYGCNYGSIATYYGLNQTIENLGYSVLMINKPSISSKKDFELGDTHAQRFSKEHYHISKSYSLEDLKDLNDVCDTFVLGSDQVWNYGISHNFGKAFYFDFVAPNKKKIAYAASFGHSMDFMPESEKRKTIDLMKKFNAISVREDQGVDIAREVYGIEAKHVLDPVFIVDRKVYDDLAAKSRFQEKEPYIATYILDPTPAKRKALLYASEKLGIKLINMLDGFPWLFHKNKEKLDLEVVENLQIEDWLYFIKNSAYVITDSCHGAAMAAIFEKSFTAITNKERGISRFSSLMNVLGVPERLVTDPELIMENPTFLTTVDIGLINQNLKHNVEASKKWLQAALEQPREKLLSVSLPVRAITSVLDSKLCTACSACTNMCPMGALYLEADEWGYYRSVIEEKKCIVCGKCEKVCPALILPVNPCNRKPPCYEMVASDQEILEASSSGGMFTLLAKEIFRWGGCIVGAAWRDDFTVAHRIVDREDELHLLQKSKYLQSYLGTVFTAIKERLEQGQFVMFTGTPCQVYGLRAYLAKDYERLLLVDILCSHAPSAMFFQKYVEDSFPEGLQSYTFRDKSKGWNCTCIKAVGKDGSVYLRNGEKEDAYQRVFHNHTMCASHCELCKYQGLARPGDLTLGDFWGISHRDPGLDSGRGVSAVLCNSERGDLFLNIIPREFIAVKKEVPLDWLGGNGYIKGNQNFCSAQRDLFQESVKEKAFSKAVEVAFHPSREDIYHAYSKGENLVSRCGDRFIFDFDKKVWEAHLVEGRTTLKVKGEVYRKTARYATTLLSKSLKRGNVYKLSVCFRVKSEAKELCFHVKDSVSDQFQVIYRHRISENEEEINWAYFSIHFIPNASIYDEFMVSASQVKGLDNYLIFDIINISE
ncbi:MAG: polysaccharide pyruvyl transferase family protein [Lachnospiraceae bacterium]|nr:polysaccharide pyruvyl transferase family protein [Lachnospiraceae bacterium]